MVARDKRYFWTAIKTATLSLELDEKRAPRAAYSLFELFPSIVSMYRRRRVTKVFRISSVTVTLAPIGRDRRLTEPNSLCFVLNVTKVSIIYIYIPKFCQRRRHKASRKTRSDTAKKFKGTAMERVIMDITAGGKAASHQMCVVSTARSGTKVDDTHHQNMPKLLLW